MGDVRRMLAQAEKWAVRTRYTQSEWMDAIVPLDKMGLTESSIDRICKNASTYQVLPRSLALAVESVFSFNVLEDS